MHKFCISLVTVAVDFCTVFAKTVVIVLKKSFLTDFVNCTCKLVLRPLIHENPGEPAPEVFIIHTPLLHPSIYCCAKPLDLCLPYAVIHCITWLKFQVLCVLINNLLPSFLNLPHCLAP